MTRQRAGFIGAAAIATALVVLAFIVAPHSCKGGLELYFYVGCAAILLLFGLPFFSGMGRSMWVRVAFAFGFLVFGTGAWFAGLFAANIRFICGLGYL